MLLKSSMVASGFGSKKLNSQCHVESDTESQSHTKKVKALCKFRFWCWNAPANFKTLSVTVVEHARGRLGPQGGHRNQETKKSQCKMATQYKWNHSTWFTGTSKGTTMRQATVYHKPRQPRSHSRATRKKVKWQSLRREVLERHKRWLVYSGSERPLHLHPLSSLMETQDFGHSMGSQEDNRHYFLVSWDFTSLNLLSTCTVRPGLGEGGMKGAVQLLCPTGKNWRAAGFFSGRSSMDFSPQDSRIGNKKPVSGIQDTRHCLLLS